jgi:hypothetical protein
LILEIKTKRDEAQRRQDDIFAKNPFPNKFFPRLGGFGQWNENRPILAGCRNQDTTRTLHDLITLLD